MVCQSSSSRRELLGELQSERLSAESTMPSCIQCVDIMCLICRLWKGITPLWGRQIPYTMMKFGESLLWQFMILS